MQTLPHLPPADAAQICRCLLTRSTEQRTSRWPYAATATCHGVGEAVLQEKTGGLLLVHLGGSGAASRRCRSSASLRCRSARRRLLTATSCGSDCGVATMGAEEEEGPNLQEEGHDEEKNSRSISGTGRWAGSSAGK
jgi:hypothetical protein